MEVLALVTVLAYLLGKATMGILTTKTGVMLTGLAPEGFTITSAIERATRVFNVNLVITSAVRPDDSDSQHAIGKAVDVRTANLTEQQIIALYWWLTVELGGNFVVLFEVPSVTGLTSELRAIAYLNVGATAAHFHIGAKRT